MIFIWRSPDGRTLLISSTDGYCTFIRFGEDELGELYTEVKVADSSEVKEEKMTAEKSSPTASSVSSKVGYFLSFLTNFEVCQVGYFLSFPTNSEVSDGWYFFEFSKSLIADDWITLWLNKKYKLKLNCPSKPMMIQPANLYNVCCDVGPVLFPHGE